MHRPIVPLLAVLVLLAILLASRMPDMLLATTSDPPAKHEVHAAAQADAGMMPANASGLPVVEAGGNTTCVINAAGELYCWGANSTAGDCAQFISHGNYLPGTRVSPGQSFTKEW